MTFTRDDVVTAARSYLGVRWRHQGRGPQGIDCTGLVVCVAWDLEVKPRSWDFNHYAREPDGVTMKAILDEHMEPVRRGAHGPGDVLMMRHLGTQWPAHLGILTPCAMSENGLGMVHAFYQEGKAIGHVIENAWTDVWRQQTSGIYRYPGLGT